MTSDHLQDQDTFAVRDSRQTGWFWVDRSLIREEGHHLGVYAVAVYCALASFANGDQQSWPSIAKIAYSLDISENTVREALRKLEEEGWIRSEARTAINASGKLVRLSNRYHLLDRSQATSVSAPTRIPDDVGHNSNGSKNGSGAPTPAPVKAAPVAAVAPPKTSVVNVRIVNGKRPDFDVYIGRAGNGFAGSEWANPFKVGTDGDHAEVVAKYREYLLGSRPDLLQRIPELIGKRLGCWCAPQPCHGDVLAELAESYRAGTWQPPDPSSFAPYDAPALLTVEQIKALKLTRQQWATLAEKERLGKKRVSVIKFAEAKLMAHPLEPRFDEMMQAVDACTEQSINDPGMAEIFAKLIRNTLWRSRDNYYTPEELMAFAKENGKVENVYWLPNALSRWRQKRKGASDGPEKRDEEAAEELWRKLGRDAPPSQQYREVKMSGV